MSAPRRPAPYPSVVRIPSIHAEDLDGVTSPTTSAISRETHYEINYIKLILFVNTFSTKTSASLNFRLNVEVDDRISESGDKSVKLILEV